MDTSKVERFTAPDEMWEDDRGTFVLTSDYDALAAENKRLAEALREYVNLGEPERLSAGGYELWSNWQRRVKIWQEARAALGITKGDQHEDTAGH